MNNDVSVEELEALNAKIDNAEKIHAENEKLNRELDDLIAQVEDLIRGPKTSKPETPEGVTHGK